MWWVVLAACGGGTGGETATGPSDTGPSVGTLSVSFQMTESWIEALGTGETAAGHFWGSIYSNDDVDSFGPVDGAVALQDLELDLDLGATGGPVGPLLTTDPLPEEIVVILGFMDTDHNADTASPDPDTGDPVTLIGENKFQVAGDTDTPATVLFDFLNP